MSKLKYAIYYLVLLFFIGVIVISMFSCKREHANEFLGPAVCPGSHFSYTTAFQVNKTNVDFSTGDTLVVFAAFNETLPWLVTIRGLESKAVKTYTGNNDTIKILWKGNADEGPFFREEECVVEYTLACSPSVTKNVTIYPNTFANFGILISDFDGAGSGNFSVPYGLFIDKDVSGKVDTPIEPSPQGGKYYRLVGDSKDSLVWGFGGFWSMSNLSSLGITDPRKVYFNAFLNSNGFKTSDVTFTFQEGGAPKNIHFTIDWTGWKMVSFPMVDAGIVDVSKVTQMDVYLGNSPQKGTKGEFNLDFVIVTPNAPFYTK